MLIPITVTGKVATVHGSHIIVCGNSDYKLKLTFDEEWADRTLKTVRFVFVTEGKVKSIDVPFNGEEVAVPTLIDTKDVYIGIYAGDLQTTTPARVPCVPSIRCMAAEPEEPTPNVYDQIIAMINAGLNADTVKYIKQTLSPVQQAQARENIEVYSKTESDGELNAIRVTLQGLSDRVNAVLDSDDNTLDGLSEIVAYIKANKDILDGVTVNKVNKSDIVDNLETNASDKPLSAAQGFELKKQVDGKAPAYTYGTDDITAGSASSYPTGTLHFVYE